MQTMLVSLLLQVTLCCVSPQDVFIHCECFKHSGNLNNKLSSSLSVRGEGCVLLRARVFMLALVSNLLSLMVAT